MTKEKLIACIMKECAADGEPVTKEEAEKMVEMEIKAGEMRRYEKSDTPRKPAKRERKVDEKKKHLLDCCRVLLEGLGSQIVSIKTETEISFIYDGEEFSFKLVKHRTNSGD
jgi:hypothetical protein